MFVPTSRATSNGASMIPPTISAAAKALPPSDSEPEPSLIETCTKPRVGTVENPKVRT